MAKFINTSQNSDFAIRTVNWQGLEKLPLVLTIFQRKNRVWSFSCHPLLVQSNVVGGDRRSSAPCKINFFLPNVILLPIQSAIVPKQKLPTNIPAIYKLWAKDFFHWSLQTIPKSMVAVDVNISVSPTQPFWHATSVEENWSSWQVKSLVFKGLKKARWYIILTYRPAPPA